MTMAEARNNPGQNSPSRYPGTFLLALKEALAQMQWQPQRWLGMAVACVDQNGHEQVLGLENLYRRLRREDRGEWPRLIAEMLQNVPAESSETVALADATERLLLRLGPPFQPLGEGKDIWYQPIVGKSLGVTLVIDHPNTMAYVSEEQIEQSGHDAAHWLEQALENLRNQTAPDCITPLHEESGLLHCEVGDAYDSSRAMLLDWLIPGHEEDGFFVAVPGRDQLLVLPVSREALKHVGWLRMVAGKMHQSLPYAISPDVFWLRQGTWHPFGVEVDGDKLLVAPPPEFAEVLQRLAPDMLGEGLE
jgi:hypothetical protein